MERGLMELHYSSLEVRALVGVGCHMPRHIRTVIQAACNTGGREGSSCGRGEKGGQIQILAIHPLVLPYFKTMGAMGPKSMALLREVGRRVAAETGDPEPRSKDYLLQRLSVAVQRGN